MHPFPPTEDLKYLLADDAVLESLLVGQFQVGLFLGNGFTIQASNPVKHVRSDGEINAYDPEASPKDAVTIHELLGKRLESITTDELLLTLTFETGDQIQLQTDHSPYEAVQIFGPANQLDVF